MKNKIIIIVLFVLLFLIYIYPFPTYTIKYYNMYENSQINVFLNKSDMMSYYGEHDLILTNVDRVGGVYIATSYTYIYDPLYNYTKDDMR